MRIDTCCGSCTRELLLGQLVQPSDGFRCPVSGFAFVPAYASAAPDARGRRGRAGGPGHHLTRAWSMTGDARQCWRRAATSPARSARTGRVTLGGPGLCPGGPSLASEPNLGSRHRARLACLLAHPRRPLTGKRPIALLACRSSGARIAFSERAM
jgi:hypothetical protein